MSNLMTTLWNVFVVGKPGYDYSQTKQVFHGTILSWKFAEMSREDLIAQVAEVNREQAALGKWVEAAKEILKNKIEDLHLQVGDTKEVVGKNGWVANYSFCQRTGLDTEKIKINMGDAWVNAHSKTTDYYEIRFKHVD